MARSNQWKCSGRFSQTGRFRARRTDEASGLKSRPVVAFQPLWKRGFALKGPVISRSLGGTWRSNQHGPVSSGNIEDVNTSSTMRMDGVVLQRMGYGQRPNQSKSLIASSVKPGLPDRASNGRYLTSTIKSPQAGAVPPAIERSCAFRTRSTSFFVQVPLPT